MFKSWQDILLDRYQCLYGDAPHWFTEFHEEELNLLSSSPNHLAMLLHAIHENRQHDVIDVRYRES